MCQPLPYALSIPLLLPPKKQCVEAQSSPLEPPRNTAEQPAGSQGLAGAPEGSGLAQLHISHAWHTTGI